MATNMQTIKDLMAANKIATLKFDTARKLRAVALYDAAQKTNKRRTPKVETGNESELLPAKDRIQGIANVRDVERNFSNARGIMLQLKANVVGTLGKLRINTPDGEGAANWFNGVYAKDCSARNDDHLSDVFEQFLACRHTGGDCIVLVDTDFHNKDAKLWIWESDQICNMSKGDFDKEYGVKGHTQEQGVVRDAMGIELGYFVSTKRGAIELPSADITFLSKDIARLIKKPTRPNQGRGVADLLTASGDMFDMYDMRSRELDSAKVASTLIGKVKRASATPDYDDPVGAIGGDADITAGSDGVEAAKPMNYEAYEALLGGRMEYMDSLDDFEILKIDRPNVNFEGFNDFVLGSAGFSVGMSRVYATGKATASYTAFRGEQLMTWVASFFPAQKWLERRAADWIATKVITWAIGKGIVSLAEGWESKISWVWPIMPEVNQLQSAQANAAKMKNGESSLLDIVGPDWKKNIDALAEMNAYAKAKGVHLASMETVAGAVVDEQQLDTGNNQEEPDTEDGEGEQETQQGTQTLGGGLGKWL